MKRPRVLVAEDHAAVAQHLRVVLDRDCDVIAMVSDGYALIGAAQALLPDVVVTDISMPGVDGIVAAQRITQSHPEIRVVIVTVHNDSTLMERAFESGAIGYVLKLAADEELPAAVKAAMGGRRFVSPQMGNRQDRAG